MYGLDFTNVKKMFHYLHSQITVKDVSFGKGPTTLEAMTAVAKEIFPSIATPPVLTQAEQARRILLERVTSSNRPTVVPAPKGDFNQAIEKKLDEIAGLAMKIILTEFILPGQFYDIYEEATKKTLNPTLFDENFYKELDQKFQTSNKSTSSKERLIYWLHIHVTSVLINYYISGVKELVKKDLFAYLDKNPEEKINEIFKVVLAPLKTHMSVFYSFNEALRNEKLKDSVEGENEKRLNAELPIDLYLLDFANILVNKYVPDLSIPKVVETIFNKNLPQNPLLKQATAALKTMLVWLSNHLPTTLTQFIDSSIKNRCQKELCSLIKTHLFTTESGANKTRSLFQYKINKAIKDQLIHLETSKGADASSKTGAPLKLSSSTTKLNELGLIIVELLENIRLSSAMNSPQSVGDYFKNVDSASWEHRLYTMAIKKIGPEMALDFLKGMELVAYNKSPDGKALGPLSEIIWHAIWNVHQEISTRPVAVSDTDMSVTETDMHDLLEQVVHDSVKTGVQTAVNPTKKLQDETTAIIQALKVQSSVFINKVQKWKDKLAHAPMIMQRQDFNEIKTAWDHLNQDVMDLLKQFKSYEVKKISQYGANLLVEFEEASKALPNGALQALPRNPTKDLTTMMDNVKNHLDQIDKLQQQNELLMRIQRLIGTEKDLDKIAKLEIVEKLDWISPEFKSEAKKYREYLSHFIRTSTNADVISLRNAYSNGFTSAFTNEIQRVKDSIAHENNMIASEFALLSLDKMTTWNSHLAPLDITSWDVNSIVSYVYRPIINSDLVVNTLIVPQIMTLLKELLTFKQKSYHWNGVLGRVTKAFNDYNREPVLIIE